MKSYVTIWCEWDIGQSDVIFKTKEDAIAWVMDRTVAYGIDESWDELRQEGLVGFDDVYVWESKQ